MRYGALIGDIAGSRFEGVSNDYFNSVPYSLLKPEDKWYSSDNTDYSGLVLRGRFTDDSVLSLAVAEAILLHRETGEPLEALVIKQFQEKYKAFFSRGFGGLFSSWAYHDKPEPYGSYGNGAAMRVSSCAWLAETYEQALDYARIVTNVTHNHSDSLWGAEVVVTAIWLLYETKDKEFVKEVLKKKYGLDIENVVNADFQINCKLAVTLAFKAFYNANSFLETIHKAICFGGDTDTIAAIAGSIAEALYPIDQELIEQTKTFFGEQGVSAEWEEPVAYEVFKAFSEWKEPEHQKADIDSLLFKKQEDISLIKKVLNKLHKFTTNE